jgi:hypothetical protein
MEIMSKRDSSRNRLVEGILSLREIREGEEQIFM